MFQVRPGLAVIVALVMMISSTSASTYVSYDAPPASDQQRDSSQHREKRQLDALTDAFSLEKVSQAMWISTASKMGG